MVDAIANFSFTTHFRSTVFGLIELSGIIYFVSLSAVSILATIVVLER